MPSKILKKISAAVDVGATRGVTMVDRDHSRTEKISNVLPP